MARRPTTFDPFNAIAEPRRRRILNFLRRGERSVGDVVRATHFGQPQVSKHLGVLRKVGLVAVRGSGRRRLYRLNARGLKPVHQWVSAFERFWNESFDRLDACLKELQQQEKKNEP
ncbi:MAG: winged helix-turn-helix transcriptional regulator [Planctomycetia bacterium]|nr:winged helix-turn-helix transcriptional regulator [Planctomycetia bacterium]